VNPEPDNHAPDCSQARVEPAALWPPNHSMVPVEIVGVTDPDGDPVHFEIVQIVQDEAVGKDDVDKRCADALIEDSQVSLRAERSGANGRVYELTFRARDARGAVCDGKVRVCVPSDSHGACIQDSLLFNSLGICAPSQILAAKAKIKHASARVISSTRARAEIEYSLPRDGEVSLAIYDLAGRRVALLETGFRSAGSHVASWSPGAAGRGVYFYRLRTELSTLTGSIAVQD
jgi:hypothetical protein